MSSKCPERLYLEHCGDFYCFLSFSRDGVSEIALSGYFLMKSLTRQTKVPVANKSSSGVYKSAAKKAITLTVMEGL